MANFPTDDELDEDSNSSDNRLEGAAGKIGGALGTVAGSLDAVTSGITSTISDVINRARGTDPSSSASPKIERAKVEARQASQGRTATARDDVPVARAVPPPKTRAAKRAVTVNRMARKAAPAKKPRPRRKLPEKPRRPREPRQTRPQNAAPLRRATRQLPGKPARRQALLGEAPPGRR